LAKPIREQLFVDVVARLLADAPGRMRPLDRRIGAAQVLVDHASRVPLLASPERDEQAIGGVVSKYELDIDFGTIPELITRHGLE
jgi:hypothetical protein